MNDPEPKHSPLCQCENCQHFEREYAKLMASNSDMRSVLAFHASVTTQELFSCGCKPGDYLDDCPQHGSGVPIVGKISSCQKSIAHWLIKLAREVAGTPGARAALNSSFVYCVRDLAKREGCTIDQIHQAVAALAEAEAILDGKQEPVKCPECGGRGAITRRVQGNSEDWTAETKKCWRCKGDGIGRALVADAK